MKKLILLLTILLFVGIVNAAGPILNPIPSPFQINENHTFTYQVTAIDPEGHSLEFSDNSELFDIDPNTGIISFTPTIDDIGQHFVVIIVMDTVEYLIDSEVIQLNINGLPILTPLEDKNVKSVIEAGANIIVAGSYFFGAKDPGTAVKKLRSA